MRLCGGLTLKGPFTTRVFGSTQLGVLEGWDVASKEV